MGQTVKNDWLNNWLSNNNNTFVSGDDKFRNSLNLPLEAKSTIRYINLRSKYLWILTIEAPEEVWRSVKEQLENNGLFNSINSKFQNKLNVLLFSPNTLDSFSYKSHNGNYIDTDSNGLQTMLNKELPEVNQNLGTRKEMNKSINDNFQIWTRSNLSKYCVINDFDAVYLSDKQNIIYELKRVKEDISTWEPYIDDSRNYQRINQISSQLDFSNITIAYNLNNTSIFAVHKNLIPQASQISGVRAFYDVQSNGYITNSQKEYASKRKRQK